MSRKYDKAHGKHLQSFPFKVISNPVSVHTLGGSQRACNALQSTQICSSWLLEKVVFDITVCSCTTSNEVNPYRDTSLSSPEPFPSFAAYPLPGGESLAKCVSDHITRTGYATSELHLREATVLSEYSCTSLKNDFDSSLSSTFDRNSA